MNTPLDALNSAISTAGSQAKFAASLGVSQPTVHGWRALGRAPEDRCPTIEALYGVRCEALRPDTVWTRDKSGNVTGYHVPANVSIEIERNGKRIAECLALLHAQEAESAK